MAVRARGLRLALTASLLLLSGCRRSVEPAVWPPHPVVLVGIDGADWEVIHDLWARGELPTLRRLAAAGTSATLRTDYGNSAVIWTSIATGRTPSAHGIVDFVVPTAHGDVPVASTLRRVPALWSMASTAGRRVAVVSWWASWPAEPVRGVVVSDRAVLGLEGGVSPASFQPRFEALRSEALSRPSLFGNDDLTAQRDRVTAQLARTLAGEGYDLTMVYFRSVDVASHFFWRFLYPQRFGASPPTEAAGHGGEIARVYAATDRALGDIVKAAPQANVLVVSDHGFHGLRREQVTVTVDFDLALARLGYLARRGDAIDWARTRVYTWASPPHARLKGLRFALAGREAGGRVKPAERAALQAALARDLERVRWDGGGPVFRVRSARPRQQKAGMDMVVSVLPPPPSVGSVRLDGEPWPGLIAAVSRISGMHGAHTHGIFVAAGPDVVRGAPVAGIHIHDIAPTVLYAMGLPVADDFAGRARTDLFVPAFQRRHPLRHIRTWGKPRPGRATASNVDAELVRELRALGYLR